MIKRIDISLTITEIGGAPNFHVDLPTTDIAILYNPQIISEETVIALIRSNTFDKDMRVCCVKPSQADYLLTGQTETNTVAKTQQYFTINEIIHEAARIYNFNMPSPGTQPYRTIHIQLERALKNQQAMQDGKQRHKRYQREVVMDLLENRLKNYFIKKSTELA